MTDPTRVTMTPADLSSLVESEIRKIGDARVAAHIRQLLVTPRPVYRQWDYGQPGEAYLCWSVLEHPASNTGICYCESGFGPRSPWGLVFLSGSPPEMSMGMDAAWYTSLEEAYFECSAATDLPIWRVYRRRDGEDYPGTPLTPEGDWEATWEEVRRWRERDTAHRYHCSHTLQKQKE